MSFVLFWPTDVRNCFLSSRSPRGRVSVWETASVRPNTSRALVICSAPKQDLPKHKPKKAVIIDAGPAGVVTAAYLAKRPHLFGPIEVYDFRQDPRIQEGLSSYGFIIGRRGWKALEDVGLADHGKAASVPVQSVRNFVDSAERPAFYYDSKLPFAERSLWLAALISGSNALYPNVVFHFGESCKSVDAKAKHVVFSSGKTVEYDLLVGADGVNSAVRESLSISSERKPQGTHFLASRPFKYPGHHPVVTPEFDSMVLLSLKHAASCFIYGRCDGLLRSVVVLRRGSPGLALWESGDLEGLRAFVLEAFPSVADLLSESLETNIGAKEPSSVLASSFHHGDSIILVGDAAHAVWVTVGIGCSTALEDCTKFMELLDSVGENVEEAVQLWTDSRKPDAVAAINLSAYMFSPLEQEMVALVTRFLQPPLWWGIPIVFNETLLPLSKCEKILLRQKVLIWLVPSVSIVGAAIAALQCLSF